MVARVATRYLPPLAVIAAFGVPVVLLAPDGDSGDEIDEAALQRTICLDLPIPDPPTSEIEADLASCLEEWNAREPGDAELLVRLRINDGSGSAETEAGPDSPMLRLCVAEAIGRMRMPRGDYIEADMFVRWTKGRVKLTGAVTYRTPAIREQIDFGPAPTRADLRRLEREHARLRREIERHRARAHGADESR